MIFNPTIDIALVSVAGVCISQFLQHKMTDRKKMKEQQKKIGETQKKMNELMKKTDQKSQDELKRMQDDMMKTMNEMMGKNMKFMVVSMVIFLPLYYFLGAVYEKEIVNLPFPIPWLGGSNFIMLYTQTSWIGWYIFCSLVMSLLFSAALNFYDKSKESKVVKQ